MSPTTRTSRFRPGLAVAVSVLVVLVGCGSESDDTTIATGPGATTHAGAAAVDLTDVRFDVHRDPG